MRYGDQYDCDALRDRLMDECGTAYAFGMWPALEELSQVESASESEHLSMADRLGVDAESFEI